MNSFENKAIFGPEIMFGHVRVPFCFYIMVASCFLDHDSSAIGREAYSCLPWRAMVPLLHHDIMITPLLVL